MRPVARLRWLAAIAADRTLPGAAMSVAAILAECINAERGTAFPGLSYLAEESGLNLATIKRSLGALERGGWLQKHRGGGRGKATEWRAINRRAEAPVSEAKADEMAPAKQAHKQARKQARSDTPNRVNRVLKDFSPNAFDPGLATVGDSLHEKSQARRSENSEGEKRKANGAKPRNWARASDAELVSAAAAAGIGTVGKSRDELVAALKGAA